MHLLHLCTREESVWPLLLRLQILCRHHQDDDLVEVGAIQEKSEDRWQDGTCVLGGPSPSERFEVSILDLDNP